MTKKEIYKYLEKDCPMRVTKKEILKQLEELRNKVESMEEPMRHCKTQLKCPVCCLETTSHMFVRPAVQNDLDYAPSDYGVYKCCDNSCGAKFIV